MWEGQNRTKIRGTDVIVLDEVSMLSGELFDRLSEKVAAIRRRHDYDPLEPFGGIQLILSGDFLQLPPVVEDVQGHPPDVGVEEVFLNRGFCFQARAWAACKIHTVELHRVHRQDGDDEFIDALRDIRMGSMTARAQWLFRECSRPLPPKNGTVPTVLYCRNVDVDRINRSCRRDGARLCCSVFKSR